MNYMQQTLFTVIYFACLLPITYLSFRWVWELLCNAGGTTPEEVKQKKRELFNRTVNPQIQFRVWLEQNATDVMKFRRIYNIYSTCTTTNIIFLAFAFSGFVTPALNKLVKLGMVIVPTLIICSLIAKMIYKHKSK